MSVMMDYRAYFPYGEIHTEQYTIDSLSALFLLHFVLHLVFNFE
jgi:hypothetical protein